MFKGRFEALQEEEKLEVISFMEQLAAAGEMLHGKKALQYSREKFLMEYLYLEKERLHAHRHFNILLHDKGRLE